MLFHNQKNGYAKAGRICTFPFAYRRSRSGAYRWYGAPWRSLARRCRSQVGAEVVIACLVRYTGTQVKKCTCSALYGSMGHTRSKHAAVTREESVGERLIPYG